MCNLFRQQYKCKTVWSTFQNVILSFVLDYIYIYTYNVDFRPTNTSYVFHPVSLQYQALSRARKMARGWGDTSLDDMCTQPGEATENKLAAYEDVTAELVTVDAEQMAQLPACATSFNKAAVMTFQTWQQRLPGIVGICLGETKGSRTSSTNIVVGKSFEVLFASETLKKFRTEHNLQGLGVILAGSHSDDKLSWINLMTGFQKEGVSDPVCVLVA